MSMNAQEKHREKTVSVSATAETKVNPDEVVFSVSINKKGATFEEATRDLDKEISQAKRILTKEKIDEDKIETTTYNVNKNYYWDNGKRIDDGYMATSMLEAKNELNTKLINKILSRFAKESPDLNLNLAFSISDDLMEKTRNELLKKAVRRAKSKAEAICDALGKDIQDIQSVNYSEDGGRPVYQKSYADSRMMRTASAQEDAPPIENIKDVNLSLSVQTIWTIE